MHRREPATRDQGDVADVIVVLRHGGDSVNSGVPAVTERIGVIEEMTG
jgi:hypothetical protein